VVNFVMKHDFEGVQLDAQIGTYQHDQHNSLVQGVERQANGIGDLSHIAIPGTFGTGYPTTTA